MTKPGDVEKAVKSQLDAMPELLRKSPLAAIALAFGRDFDAAGSIPEKVSCARALREALSDLRARAPEPDRPLASVSTIDDLRERVGNERRADPAH